MPLIVGGSLPFPDDLEHPRALYKAGRLKPLKDRAIQTRILGAASGAQQQQLTINSAKMVEMTDPYSSVTRTDFSTAAHTDPTLSEALKNRNAAFFKNGFTLQLQLKSMKRKPGEKPTIMPDQPISESKDEEAEPEPERSNTRVPLPTEGDTAKTKPGQSAMDLNPEEAEMQLQAETANYSQFIQQLEDWADDPNIQLDKRMKAANWSSAVQGRSVTLVFPAVNQLAKGELPVSLKSISYEDIGPPIIDIEFWRLLAIRLNNLEPKLVALPDEMVHIERNAYADRKDAWYYGMSDLEASIQASKIYKKIINYDFAKAAVAGYMTKLFLKVPLEGVAELSRPTIMQGIINRLVTQGTDVLAVESGIEIEPSPVKVDTDMLQMLVEKLENLLIANGGSTKSQMGRTDNLNRDNATVQEIAFIKYRREPDEELIKTAFEDLLNKLLAHLASRDFKEIPVRVIIVRKEPPDEEIDTEDDAGDKEDPDQAVEDNKGKGKGGPSDANMDRKKGEIDDADKTDDEDALKQKGSKRNTFGASALEEELMRSEIEKNKAIAEKVEGL